MNKKIAVIAAALSALVAGAVAALPAGAGHGSGLKQVASAALEGGTLTVNPGDFAEVCFGDVCTNEPIPVDVTSIGLAVDYVLLRSETHLPDVITAAGLPCSTSSGQDRPGAVVDIGAGSFQSFNGLKLVIRNSDGTAEEREILPPGDRAGTMDPPPATVCLLKGL